MGPDDIRTRIAEAARSFDAELHTAAYAETHADDDELQWLLERLPRGEGQTVLDLGTGNGYVAFALAGLHPTGRVVGLDVAAGAIECNRALARERALENLDFRVYDGVDLPFRDRSLDAAVSRYALHHFPLPDRSLSELARTLRPRGTLALADAVRDEEDDVDFVNRFQSLKLDGHQRMLRPAELLALAGRHGFRLEETFESAIAFTRGRTKDYDAVIAATPGRVLDAYAVRVSGRQVGLEFRILNAVFSRPDGDGA